MVLLWASVVLMVPDAVPLLLLLGMIGTMERWTWPLLSILATVEGVEVSPLLVFAIVVCSWEIQLSGLTVDSLGTWAMV